MGDEGGVGVLLGGAARGKDGREADFCCKVDESPFGARTSPTTRDQMGLSRPTVRRQFILFGVHFQVASSRCMKNHPVWYEKYSYMVTKVDNCDESKIVSNISILSFWRSFV